MKDLLVNLYRSAAQYDEPPQYPVNMICNGIDNSESDYILSKIYAGVVAYLGNYTCYPISPIPVTNTTSTPATSDDIQEIYLGWSWMVYTYYLY